MSEPVESVRVSGGGRRIAFFGGSFDPPHLGHLAVARAAKAALGLDEVLFAPVGTQPLKPGGATASFEDRLAMTRLAIEGEAGFEVSLADAPRITGIPNYTLETLRGLQAALTAGSQLFCLMGADSFVGLRRWHRAAEIPFEAPLIVASRPGERLDSLVALLPPGLTMESEEAPEEVRAGVAVRCYFLLNETGGRTPFYVLPELDVEICASAIRAEVRAARGKPSDGRRLLPEAVWEYLLAYGLYGS